MEKTMEIYGKRTRFMIYLWKSMGKIKIYDLSMGNLWENSMEIYGNLWEESRFLIYLWEIYGKILWKSMEISGKNQDFGEIHLL